MGAKVPVDVLIVAKNKVQKRKKRNFRAKIALFAFLSGFLCPLKNTQKERTPDFLTLSIKNKSGVYQFWHFPRGQSLIRGAEIKPLQKSEKCIKLQFWGVDKIFSIMDIFLSSRWKWRFYDIKLSIHEYLNKKRFFRHFPQAPVAILHNHETTKTRCLCTKA